MALNLRAHLPSRYICQAFRQPVRSFSSSAPSQNQSEIPPESPRFIEVPLPPQQFQKKVTRVRGRLPVPRNLFPRGTIDRASPLFLDQVTQEPTHRKIRSKLDKHSEHLEHSQWMRKMAEKRRTNLREGVLELHQRNIDDLKTAKQIKRFAARENRLLRTAPPRSDELFTGSSVTEVLRDIYERDKERGSMKDFEAKRANYARHVKRQETRKIKAIHTLYMHARDFITTEKQLNDAIELAFTHPDGTPRTESVWGEHGDADQVTMNTRDMLEVSHEKGIWGRNVRIRTRVTTERMTKIAEALTGGEMSVPR